MVHFGFEVLEVADEINKTSYQDGAKPFESIFGLGNIHLPFTLMLGREGCDPSTFFHYLRKPPA